MAIITVWKRIGMRANNIVWFTFFFHSVSIQLWVLPLSIYEMCAENSDFSNIFINLICFIRNQGNDFGISV